MHLASRHAQPAPAWLLLFGLLLLAFNHAAVAGGGIPGGLTFSYLTLLETPIPAATQTLVFFLLLAGFAVKKAAHSMRNGVGQPGEFGAGGCGHPSKPRARTCVIHIDAVEEQHVEVDIEVERTAEALGVRDEPQHSWLDTATRWGSQAHPINLRASTAGSHGEEESYTRKEVRIVAWRKLATL